MNTKPRRCDNCRYSVRYPSGEILGCLFLARITSPEERCDAHKFKTGKPKSK